MNKSIASLKLVPFKIIIIIIKTLNEITNETEFLTFQRFIRTKL